jgi:hypothetical protein
VKYYFQEGNDCADQIKQGNPTFTGSNELVLQELN